MNKSLQGMIVGAVSVLIVLTMLWFSYSLLKDNVNTVCSDIETVYNVSTVYEENCYVKHGDEFIPAGTLLSRSD